MLTARKAPRACISCRAQLQTLFEQGFTSSPHLRPLLRHQRLAVRGTTRGTSFHGSIANQRLFSSSEIQREHQAKASHNREDGQGAKSNIEDVVRHARQTFGETLPRDFLNAEEYALYERLYGPPVRETRGDDFETLDAEGVARQTEGGEGSGRGRNVLLRENADGTFEEVDFDSGFGYREVEIAVAMDGDKDTNVEGGESLSYEEFKELHELVGREAENANFDPIETGQLGILENVSELDLDLDKLDGDGVPGLGKLEEGRDSVQVEIRSQRELDAILRLQKDMDAAAARIIEEEDIDEELEEEEEMEESEEEGEEDEGEPDAYLGGDSVRTHPRTIGGRFGTSPSTLTLPKEQFILPITKLLSRTNNKHLTEAAERAFGGPGLPYSTATPVSKKTLPQRHIGLEASQHRMSEIEADAFIAALMPGMYASIMSTLVEVRKRLGSSWIRELFERKGGEGPRILDAGSGGAGVVAWREILGAEWDILRSEGFVPKNIPMRKGKATVLTGPSTLRHRVSRFLNDTTFLPRLPDYVHSSNSGVLLDGASTDVRKSYDIIIATHTLYPLKEDHRRKHMVNNLWSLLDPDGGVLILIEKGLPRGFEAIAGARSLLLKKHISSPSSTHYQTLIESHQDQFIEKEQGMIIAPCTSHTQCPMYKIEGLSSGRKDFCHFTQRLERPGFLQKVLGANKRNHEAVQFSYLAVRRGVDSRQSASNSTTNSVLDPNSSTDTQIIQGDSATDAAFAGYEEFDSRDASSVETNQTSNFSYFSLPRAILPPLKRRGHVTLDLCTPSGTLERWIVPKSFSTQAYRDARKSSHGDLWALGAKTRILREARIGKKGVHREAENPGKGWMKGKNGKPLRKKKGKKANVFEIDVGEKGMEDIREVREGRVNMDEKRTRGGRLEKPRKEIGLDDF